MRSRSKTPFINPQVAAAELLRFGTGVDVEAPEEVRAALAEWGHALVAAYGVRPAARLAGR